MNNFAEKIDQSIVLLINGWNTPVLDETMWIVSSKIIWIPLYVYLIYLASKKLNYKQTILFTIIAIMSVVFSDLISHHCFKEVFQRFRPSHNLLLINKLHFYKTSPDEFYQGGLYGFVSSHAANFFAIALFTGLALKEYYPRILTKLLIIASFVSFSRIYLGVHYLSDIVVGAIVGSLISYILYRFVYLDLKERYNIK